MALPMQQSSLGTSRAHSQRSQHSAHRQLNALTTPTLPASHRSRTARCTVTSTSTMTSAFNSAASPSFSTPCSSLLHSAAHSQPPHRQQKQQQQRQRQSVRLNTAAAQSAATTVANGKPDTAAPVKQGGEVQPPELPSVDVKLHHVARGFERAKLLSSITSARLGGSITQYQNSVHVGLPRGDLYFFDTEGVVVAWGVEGGDAVNAALASGRAAAAAPLLSRSDGRADAGMKAGGALALRARSAADGDATLSLAGDVLTLPRHTSEPDARRAVAAVLAQSLALKTAEDRTFALSQEAQALPEALAATGQVPLSAKEIARRLGQLFLLKRSAQSLAVQLDLANPDRPGGSPHGSNGLRSLSDGGGGNEVSAGSGNGFDASATWDPTDVSPAALQQELGEVLELTVRTERLISALEELQDLLEEVRDLESNAHGSRLEWIVIVLVAVEAIVGIAEFVELFANGGFGLK